LVAALVDAMPPTEGLTIDLGAGTGIVTECLLRRGVMPMSIVAVECCKSLARSLQSKYTQVLVLNEDAGNLGALLDAERQGEPVRAVLSSLPFRAMPRHIVAGIARELRRVLHERGGCLIQYSYLWWQRYPLRKFGFAPRHRCLVVKNVPPAVVEVYTVQ
jgi:phosphatidylethanolamine/phosphatidyl-N-methylethanolamine N-methyltransferase